MAFGGIRQGGALAWALALALVLAGTAGGAGAESGAGAKQAGHAAEPAAAATAPQPARAAGAAPARFFTINQLLAKHGAGRTGAAGRLAAVPPASATDAAPADPAPPAPGPEPFRLYAFRAPEGALWVKWRGLDAELKAEAAELARCRAEPASCSPAATRFLAIVAATEARAGRARLETANRLVNNAIRYVSDLEQHGVPDRWSAPLATLAAGQGDCEDYAIAKWAALRAAGVAEADLRLVLVRDMAVRIDHAVLAVRADGRWLVLDNRRAGLAEPGELAHYLPLYAVDAAGVQLYAAPYARWGEGDSEFAHWTLRGGESAEFAAWTLRGSDGDVEPAATAEREF